MHFDSPSPVIVIALPLMRRDFSFQARKFGVRAAMPGFIARKLCPDLIFVSPDFKKYTYYSDLTRKGQTLCFFPGKILYTTFDFDFDFLLTALSLS